MADQGSTQQGRVGADGSFAAAKLNAVGAVDSVALDGSGNGKATIPHGLGYTPSSVVANVWRPPPPAPGIDVYPTNVVATGGYTPTTFDVAVTGIAGAVVSFNWIAL